jgi:lipoate-protein ligase A
MIVDTRTRGGREAEDERLGIGRWSFDDDLVAASVAASEPRARARPCPLPGAPPVAVVLGRGGKPEVEVDLAAARADGVPVLRRRGGGCAVILDPGNVIVSVALPIPGLGGIMSAFAAITEWLIAALAEGGVPGVERRGTSDLAVGDRKIGGACLWRTRGLVYYSTTLLVAPDLALIDRYLPHPPREPEWRRGRAHREFLVRLADTPGLGETNASELAARLDAVVDPGAIVLRS